MSPTQRILCVLSDEQRQQYGEQFELWRQPGIEFVFQDSPEAAIDQIGAMQPCLVFIGMDVDMMEGLEIVALLMNRYPVFDKRLIVLPEEGDPFPPVLQFRDPKTGRSSTTQIELAAIQELLGVVLAEFSDAAEPAALAATEALGPEPAAEPVPAAATPPAALDLAASIAEPIDAPIDAQISTAAEVPASEPAELPSSEPAVASAAAVSEPDLSAVVGDTEPAESAPASAPPGEAAAAASQHLADDFAAANAVPQQVPVQEQAPPQTDRAPVAAAPDFAQPETPAPSVPPAGRPAWVLPAVLVAVVGAGALTYVLVTGGGDQSSSGTAPATMDASNRAPEQPLGVPPVGAEAPDATARVPSDAASVVPDPSTPEAGAGDLRKHTTLPLTFASGRAVPANASSSSTKAALAPILRMLRHSTRRIELGGHTSREGPVSVNDSLGRRRADSVRDLLISYGIAADRIVTTNYRASLPAEAGTSPEAQAANRRVTIRLVD